MNLRIKLIFLLLAEFCVFSISPAAGETVYTWDANGNMASSVDDVGNSATYSYDANNQLTRVERQRTDGTNVLVLFEYDWQGNRTAKTVNGIRTNFVVDSSRPLPIVLEETNENGDVLVSYKYGPTDYLPTSQTRNGQTYTYHYDASNNVRVLTDSNGNIAVEYGYDSMGNLLYALGEVENDFLFGGQQFDRETQLYFHRARYRDPATSRFTQMDQHQGRTQEPATLHKYTYAHNDPVNLRDPSGYLAIGEVAARGIQTTLTTATSASLRPLVAKAVLGTVVAATGLYFAHDYATKQTIRRCLENERGSGNKCRPSMSIFIVGDSHDEIRDHVADAQTSTHSPSVVTLGAKPHDRYWITKLRRAGKVCQQPGDCDEYPMAIHEEGGQRGRTSLRSVNASQNRSIGAMVLGFHRRCKVSVGEKYKFVAAQGVPISGGICKK